jgi:3-methyladenine DNA glycosylase AlkD
MTDYADALLGRATAAFEQTRNPARAAEMAAYMRDQFAFVGVNAPERAALIREAERGLGRPSERDLKEVTRRAWARPEREYQYLATRLLRRHSGGLSPAFLPVVRTAIVTKSWWDTVDELAVHVVGDMVRRSPALRATVDEWAASDNMWLARTAILHQNRYRADTDADRLFSYSLMRAADGEFFIGKAIGWALREYSKTAPDAVSRFVRDNDARLSGLSKREALSSPATRPETPPSRRRGARSGPASRPAASGPRARR